jgi:DNA-directed RNA polymerase specialized sigma subunit
MPIGLKDSMRAARAAKEQEILDVLINRKDLSYEQIGQMFGVSEWPIKQIVKKYHLKRERGPKPVTAVTSLTKTNAVR